MTPSQHHDCPHCRGHAQPSRRALLGGLAAAGASALMPDGRAIAQAGKGRIDVHYHIFPPETLAVSRNPAQQGWTVLRAVDELDRNGIATGIASAGSTLPVDKARAFNELGAKVVRDHP